MYYQLPPPIALGMCGAIAGLIGGGFNQIFPVWVGCATGSSIGCVVCIYMMMTPEPVAQPTPEPIIIQNIYITHVLGSPKDLPIAKIVE